MNREQKERLMEKIEYDIKSDMIAQEENNKYKQALDEIESFCKNEACSPCKELEENNHCDECHNKIILDIINKAKGELIMTDKQIIVNGVDVSRCEYRDWRNFCHCDNSKENEGEKRITGRCGCKYNPDCYYKQLKSKEQECEELQNKFLELNGKAYSNSLELDQLKENLAKIKEIAENREIFCENCTGEVEDFTCNDCGYVKILQKISEVENGCI